MDWNLIRQGGHVHGIVTEITYKTLPGFSVCLKRDLVQVFSVRYLLNLQER